MNDPKHKGTEFSNIKRVWEQNEQEQPRGAEIHERGNEFSNVSDVWDENERTAPHPPDDDDGESDNS